MPSHVALDDLQDVVVGVVDECAVRLHVADRRPFKLERSESLGEGDLLVAAQMLAGEDEQRVLQPDGVEITPHRVVECGKPKTRHHGAERRVERFDIECAWHGASDRSQGARAPWQKGYRNTPKSSNQSSPSPGITYAWRKTLIQIRNKPASGDHRGSKCVRNGIALGLSARDEAKILSRNAQELLRRQPGSVRLPTVAIAAEQLPCGRARRRRRVAPPRSMRKSKQP